MAPQARVLHSTKAEGRNIDIRREYREGMRNHPRIRADPTTHQSAVARNSSLACEAVDVAVRNEHPEIIGGNLVTKTVLCDTKPFCATALLFNHQFFWNSRKQPPFRPLRCSKWQSDEDWPTTEPHLSRASARARTFWEVMQLVPNRTVWLHGDSIQLQLCDAALCSLIRAGVTSTPVLDAPRAMPRWLKDLAVSTGYNFITAVLSNGARLVCSGLGPFQKDPIRKILGKMDVAVLNFGLHYHDVTGFRTMLSEASRTLGDWQRELPAARVALWREGSAQHFRGGSYRSGDEKHRSPGERCECTPLATDKHENARVNLNLIAWKLEQAMLKANGVGARTRRAKQTARQQGTPPYCNRQR